MTDVYALAVVVALMWIIKVNTSLQTKEELDPCASQHIPPGVLKPQCPALEPGSQGRSASPEHLSLDGDRIRSSNHTPLVILIHSYSHKLLPFRSCISGSLSVSRISLRL